MQGVAGMIHLSKVTKLSAGKTALREATMILPKGSYAALQVDSEPTGNALVRLIMGYEQPDRGTVIINGIDVSNLAEARVPFLRRNIGWLEFKPNLAGNRTVIENLALPLQIAGFDRKAMRERIADKLEEARLIEDANRLVRQLDTAKLRLVACARATIHNPQTILADYPEAEPDKEKQDLIFGMLETANAGGATVLMITGKTPPSRNFTHLLQAFRGSLSQHESTATGLV